jgi:hypothetical protein
MNFGRTAGRNHAPIRPVCARGLRDLSHGSSKITSSFYLRLTASPPINRPHQTLDNTNREDHSNLHKPNDPQIAWLLELRSVRNDRKISVVALNAS